MPEGVLVGRRLAVGALRSAVDAAVAGVGGVVLLVGDAGMGKTSLAADAVVYARARGATALWGSCWEVEGAPGYWPWIQVMRALGPDASEAGRRMLAELTGEPRGSEGVLGDESALRFRTYDRAATYLRDRSRGRPLVIVLDDLHWADVSSLRLLMFLARRLHDVAVLVVGTYRERDLAMLDETGRGLLGELAGQADSLPLSALSVDEVSELLLKVCGEPAPDVLAQAVHERTAGNPFFVHQVARLLGSRGVPLDRAPLTGVPPAVGDVLTRRLARLRGDAVDLLGVASVLGREFAVATVAAVAGVSPEGAVQLLGEASQAAIVEYGDGDSARFSHDLFREVVYQGLPVARRSALHLAVAERLEGNRSAATAAKIAYHRSVALPLGDRGLVVTALVNAAREATDRTAFDEAVSHLRRAIDVRGGEQLVELAVLLEYGDALRRAGNREDARASFFAAAGRARAAGDQASLARAAFGAHRVTTLTESSRSDVIALLEEALAAFEYAPEEAGTEMRCLLLAALARELADGPHRDLARATEFATTAVELARATDDAVSLAYGLFALSDVRWEPGAAKDRLVIADELAQVAARTGETELLLEAYLSRVVALLELGDPAFALALDSFTALADRTGIPRYVYVARSRQATRASLTGPFELADELIAAAAAYGERIGESDAWGVQASQLVGLAFLRHDWTRLHDLARARGTVLMPPEFAVDERAWLLVEAGARDEAAALVAAMSDRPVTYRWRYSALLATDAELAAAVGDHARCATLYERLLPLAGQFAVVGAAVVTTGPVALQLGLVAAVLERWDDAVAHLEDAVARCERLGAHLVTDRARAELTRVITARDAGTSAATGPTNVFRRDGDVWTLTFAGRTVRRRDAKGLRDLAVLLSARGQEIHAIDLVSGGAAPSSAFGADAILDDRARAAYRSRLAELDADLTEADRHHDPERSARLAAEREQLIDELARATGLAGRRRRLGDTGERARSTVTARIRAAISRIEQVHPELGAHLRTSITTGTRCAYRPAETVRWTISQS